MSQLDKLVGVGPLVIVPGNDLDEFWTQLNTSLSIKAGGSGVGNEVLRNDRLVNELYDASHGASLSILNSLTDLFPSGFLFKFDSQIND